MLWPPDSPWAPWWKTKDQVARKICDLAEIRKNDLVYDLGSGDGSFIITAAKCTGAKMIGLEIDPLRYVQSKILAIKNKVRKRVTVKRKNFFDENLSSATVVFMYLIPKAMNKLKPKLLKELKPGTRLVTYKYEFDLPIYKKDDINKIYLYKVPKRS